MDTANAVLFEPKGEEEAAWRGRLSASVRHELDRLCCGKAHDALFCWMFASAIFMVMA